MHEAVDRSQGHGRLDEHLAPLGERRVGRDGQALVLVALGDQLEQHRGLGLVAPHVAQIVKDQQIEAVELGEFLRQPQIPPRNVSWSSEGKWVHLAKVAFEKYFMGKIRSGRSEPFYEHLAMQALGIDKLKAVTTQK